MSRILVCSIQLRSISISMTKDQLALIHRMQISSLRMRMRVRRNSYSFLYCPSRPLLVRRASNFSSFSPTQRYHPWRYWKVSSVIRSPTALARIRDCSVSISRNRRRILRWFHRRLNSNWRNSSKDRVWETYWCCRMFSNVRFSFDEFLRCRRPLSARLVRHRERKYPKSAGSTEREDNLKERASDAEEKRKEIFLPR